MNLRARVARRLRFLADRVDPTNGPRGLSVVSGFTFEEGLGVVFRDDNRGCPLWYMAADYDRAHNESGDLVLNRAWLSGRLLTKHQWVRP